MTSQTPEQLKCNARRTELEAMLKTHSLTLTTSGELDAIRISCDAWQQFCRKHYRRAR